MNETSNPGTGINDATPRGNNHAQQDTVEPLTLGELFGSLKPIPADDTCRTCMDWVKIPGWSYGEAYSEGKADCINKTVSEMLGGEITPPATFGCRFHRPKEATE